MRQDSRKAWQERIRARYKEYLQRGDDMLEIMDNLCELYGGMFKKSTILKMTGDLPQPEGMPRNGGGGGDFPLGISYGKGFAIRNGEIIA